MVAAIKSECLAAMRWNPQVERAIPFLKGYTVFNAEQCEGLPAQYCSRAEPPALPPLQRIEAADSFFAATGAVIRHGGTRAYYAEGYAATLAHECVHNAATGIMPHGAQMRRPSLSNRQLSSA
jgi:antirestriction protein ArdC